MIQRNRTFAQMVADVGETALYPDEIPTDLREVIYDWFRLRVVGNDTNFPLFFRRQIAHDYRRYAQMLRIEPGIAHYDWLVEIYEELERQEKRSDSVEKAGSRTDSKTSTLTGHSQDAHDFIYRDKTGLSQTDTRYPDLVTRETRNTADDNTSMSSNVQTKTGHDSIDHTKTGVDSKTGTETTSHDTTRSQTGEVRETDAKTGRDTLTHAARTDKTQTDNFTKTRSGTDTLAVIAHDVTDRDVTDRTTHNTTDTTSYGRTETQANTGTDTREIGHTGSDSTTDHSTDKSDTVEVTKQNPMSASYAALTPAGATAAISNGSTVPALDWQTMSTQSENFSQTAHDLTSTTTHNTTDTDDFTHGHTVTTRFSGDDQLVRTGYDETQGTGTVQTNSDHTDTHIIDQTDHDAGTRLDHEQSDASDTTAYDSTNTRTRNTTDTDRLTGQDAVTHDTKTTANETGSDTTTYDSSVSDAQTKSETMRQTGWIESSSRGTDQSVSTQNATGESSEAGVIDRTKSDAKTETGDVRTSDTTMSDGSALEHVRRTGRHGNIAAMLQQAKAFILTTDAWVWLKMQLETCFMGVYDYEEVLP